jgi:hypothetical protein
MMRLIRVVLSIIVGTVVLTVALLALSGGLRFRSPTAAMNAMVDRFDVAAGETVVARTTFEDSVCFLQCSDRTVKLVVKSDATVQINENKCEALAARVEAWSNSEVEIEMFGEQYERQSTRLECIISPTAEVFGHDDWNVVAAVEQPDSADPNGDVVTWTLTILER